MFSVDFESQPNLDIFFIISAARGVYYYNILIVGKLFMNRSMCDLANYFAQKSHEYSICLQKRWDTFQKHVVYLFIENQLTGQLLFKFASSDIFSEIVLVILSRIRKL